MLGADFDHDGVNSAGDFSLADAFCDAAETGVDESGDTAPLRALLHHYSNIYKIITLCSEVLMVV